ncbi:MAG TPA: hypothetical protein VGD81_12165 [Opitutaceae bacterium]
MLRLRSLIFRPRSLLLSSVALAMLGGCATAPSRPPIAFTGDPVIDGNAQLAAAPARDRALWEYRIAASALRFGQFQEAKAKLDDAIGLTAGTLASSGADAAKARRLFGAESAKTFIGEPYERIMASFYRGVLYWNDGEPDNARALFRSGEFIDSDTENKSYAGDWVLLDYLDGYVTARLTGEGAGEDALARARANAQAQGRSVQLPDYDRSANVLFFVEYGRGPRKYAGGEHGEQLKFFTEPSKVASAELVIAGRTVALPPYDDLNYQATTRGGRVMDHILGNKAVFKETTSNVGDVALVGAAATAAYGRGEDSGKAALALAAVGLVSKLASAATQTSADTRTWDNLPQYLSFAALRLAPDTYEAKLHFYDSSGRRLENRTQTFTVTVPARDVSTIAGASAPQDVVVFRSELPN